MVSNTNFFKNMEHLVSCPICLIYRMTLYFVSHWKVLGSLYRKINKPFFYFNIYLLFVSSPQIPCGFNACWWLQKVNVLVSKKCLNFFQVNTQFLCIFLIENSVLLNWFEFKIIWNLSFLITSILYTDSGWWLEKELLYS